MGRCLGREGVPNWSLHLFLDAFLLKLSYETVVTDVITRDHELLIYKLLDNFTM